MSQQEHELWCGAEHEATGAICQLPPGHLQNHRGAFNNGIVQWPHQPIIRMSATPAPPEASHRALREALVKVRAHTSYLPGAPRQLLAELLASIGRIADAALSTGTETHEP
jgi:hypothetical protein